MSTSRILQALFAATFILSIIPANSNAKSKSDQNGELSFVVPKSNTIITPEAVDYINSKAVDGVGKIWVFFTDKGVKSSAQFNRISSELGNAITDRAAKRRAKVGIENPDLIDVPVSHDYVSAIEEIGADLRRTSRYLNAASFEVGIERIQDIASLPFVREIRPMVGSKKEYPQEAKSETGDLKSDASDLSYGSSQGQLAQINAITAHNAGYTGAGVLIAMFDTGFRTDHTAMSSIVSSGRLLATYDFIFNDSIVSNEPEDVSSAWSHGTLTWSTTGGEWSGNLYGPAYGADFILAKTEDVRSETQVEEDNWVAAMEWADSIGADVISSSLTYSDWYTVNNYNGDFCVTTIAADIAASRGIIICNSAGNSGPSPSTLGAPADADSILTIGAVNSIGSIASFSSRGPTWDGRIKPEVVAQGVSTRCASSSSSTALTFANGTSLSCPLAAGAAALVIEANPDWSAMEVRDAIMLTAHNADNANNIYGWGIINVWEAINYQEVPDFIVGDTNFSGGIDIDDVVYLIAFTFSGGPEPMPIAASGDANGDTEIDIDDITYILAYIFSGGPAPLS